MRTAANFIIGLITMAVMFFSGAPKWAAIGVAILAFYIYCAADLVVDAVKKAKP